MENYVVSARKYRPSSFDNVVGQKALTTTLKNSIKTGKLAHAYLFCGPRGVGKTTCARIFAKNINCLSPKDNGDACGTCESCVAFKEQRSYNIHELDAASNNSVDDIRMLIEQVMIPPQIGKYKVFIIDEVHMLSPSAFNAFLKTLEEPPAHAIFVLATTEKHKILPTIISRCQIYDFNRMEVPDVVAHLKMVADKEGVSYEEEALNVIARKADGGMRDALSIFDQVVSFSNGNITYQHVISNLNVLDYDYYFKLTDELLKKDIPAIILTFNEILSKGFEANHFIGGLASHFRDLLVSRDSQTLPLLEVTESVKNKYLEQAKRCKVSFLYRALRLCNDCDINYRVSRNKRLLVEIALIQVAQAVDDEDGCGRCPRKKLSPLFNIQVKTQTSKNKLVVENVINSSNKPIEQKKTLDTESNGKQSVAVECGEKKPKILSIRGNTSLNINKVATVKELNQAGINSGIGDCPFDEGALHYYWFRYAATLPIEHSAVAGRMKHLKPVLLESNVVEVRVENNQVWEYMNALREDILNYLRVNLNNKNISLEFRIMEYEPSASRVYTPRERFNNMLQTNKGLKVLKEKLFLDIV